MPIKGSKKEIISTEMEKFRKGKLHSGTKKGPVVTNPKQAIAISLSEAKKKRKKKKVVKKRGKPRKNLVKKRGKK